MRIGRLSGGEEQGRGTRKGARLVLCHAAIAEQDSPPGLLGAGRIVRHDHEGLARLMQPP